MNKLKTFLSKHNTRGALLIIVISTLSQIYFFQTLHVPKLILPLILYYGALTLCSPYFAALTIGILEFVLLYINDTKTRLTETQLSAIDIIELKQAAAISSYSDPLITTLISLLIFSLIVGIWRKRGISWKFAILPIFLVTVLLADFNRDQQHESMVQSALNLVKMRRHSFNGKKSVRRNGIFVHLIQTIDSLKIPEKTEHAFYQNFPADINIQISARPDIYIIMCESCFTTADDSFPTPLKKLNEIGFKESIMLSPQYGGGTADAEFELLTGLPSANLRGIKYQLYGNKFHPNSLSLPSFLKDENYQTVGMHNYFSFFWKRNSVYPLLGFNEYYFIEDMGWQQHESWKPEDNYLYSKALESIKQQNDQNKSLFYFMVTMHSHGPYKDENGDLGEKHYLKLIDETTHEIFKFYDQIKEHAKTRNKDALIVIFGDHKPSLTELFIKRGIFDEDDSEIERKRKASQIPVFFKYISSRPQDIQNELAQQINMKPIYCLPGILLDTLHFDQMFFNSLKSACEHEISSLSDTQWLIKNFPLGLYGENLFSDTKNKQTK